MRPSTASMAEASVEAQAKINLRLRVLEREASGYHRLETIFQRIDLADVVRVRVTSGSRTIDCDSADVGPPDRNLAYRAALAYAEATGWPGGFAIEIEKRIPVGGGLGGGSADAGGVLRALDALSPAPLGDRLPGIAESLGSDVPFLTSELAMAIGRGRGEQLTAIKPLDSTACLLAIPDFGVSTAAAYGWLAADRKSVPPAVEMDPTAIRRWKQIVGLAVNDLEAPVRARHPVIGEMIAAFDGTDARIAMMSGSGSTVFGLYFPTSPAEPPRFPAGVRVVQTRTSTHVVPVQLVR